MKKLFYILPLLFSLMFLVSSCDSTSTSPEAVTTGTIILTSSPTGATIYEGATILGATPDTITLSAGNHTLTFKLSGYMDTTVTYSIDANTTVQKFVTLTSSLSTAQFGFTTPIQLWESGDPSATDPSGVQLSTGLAVAVGSSSANRTLADLVYSTAANYNLITASDFSNLTRVTWFKAGSGSSIDTVSAPVFDATTWTKKIPDTQANYFFAYDNDHHYSKILITNRHVSSGPGDYSWVKLKWEYNKTADDRRF